MSVPPEILFHRFFQTLAPADRGRYKGKLDLDQVQQPESRLLLAQIQMEFNKELSNERKDVPEHVEHPPFHFDYIDSDHPNALAFQYEGYSFIGMTIRLIEMVWEICSRLSRSQSIVGCLAIRTPAHEFEGLQVVLLRILLNFVLSHEYTHHVHGHATMHPESMVSNEILGEGEAGNLTQHILEAEADGYAVYHVLANLFEGDNRKQAVTLLELGGEPSTVQDKVLFGSFIVAVGAYFFARPPQELNRTSVYTLTHPPQAARVSFLVEGALGWCRQKRPDLVVWMTLDRFQTLMRGVAEAIWGMNGGKDWAAQVAFLKSEDGITYRTELGKGLRNYIQSL